VAAFFLEVIGKTGSNGHGESESDRGTAEAKTADSAPADVSGSNSPVGTKDEGKSRK
jgi:hypothetical protein